MFLASTIKSVLNSGQNKINAKQRIFSRISKDSKEKYSDLKTNVDFGLNELRKKENISFLFSVKFTCLIQLNKHFKLLRCS